ncbi:MAG: hypothetical protein ABMA25_11720 [Ilumatobacteraceae bacterium]
MPNRTIYLPDELDAASRRLGLNVSRLAQEAIAAKVAEQPEVAIEAAVDAALRRIERLGIRWPDDVLAGSRAEAGER